MNKTKTFLLYWLPALVWLGAIAMFSGEGFSAMRTGGLLVTVLGWMGIELSAASLATVHFFIRKSAHVVAYGILSALLFRAWRGPEPWTSWRSAWAIAALVMCLVTSVADEVNQLYTPGRGGSALDVLLDMAGAAAAQAMIWMKLREK